MFCSALPETVHDIVVGLKRKRHSTDYYESYNRREASRNECPITDRDSGGRSSGSSGRSTSSGASSETLDIKAAYDRLLSRLPELISLQYSKTMFNQCDGPYCHPPSSAGKILDQTTLNDLLDFACQGADLVMQTESAATGALGGHARGHSPVLISGPDTRYSITHSLPEQHVQSDLRLSSAHNSIDPLGYHHRSTSHRHSVPGRSPIIEQRHAELSLYPRNPLPGPKTFERTHEDITASLISNHPQRQSMVHNVAHPAMKSAVRCLNCDKRETPEWRKGPYGPRTLCNACGLVWAKIQKKRAKEASASAKTNGVTAPRRTPFLLSESDIPFKHRT